MNFTDQVIARVLEAIERLPVQGPLVCPICNQKTWELENGFFLFSAQRASHTINLNSPNALCCVAITCKTCGNTHFLNALKLGFTENEVALIEAETSK